MTQALNFLVKFGLVLVYILKVCRKKPSLILLTKNISNSLLEFFPFIYLSRIINYWGSVFTLYLTWRPFILGCVLSAFFFILSSFFFLSVFSLIDINDLQGSKEGKGNHYFSCFQLPLAKEHLSHLDLYHSFSLDLFVITRLIANETCSS